MAIDFPNNPNSGDTFSVGNITWRYNGYAWNRIPDPGSKGQKGEKGQKGVQGIIGDKYNSSGVGIGSTSTDTVCMWIPQS